MPTSRPYHLTWLCNEIINLHPQSILDIGIGFGSKGMLFREYTDVWNGNMFERKVRIDGVEIFPEYITDLQKGIYDNIYIGDILQLIDTLDCYDLIYMGDVLEHISRDDGFKLIEKLKKKSRDLIIVTPLVVGHQGAVYGNSSEAHISQWSTLDFDGFTVLEINNSLVLHWEKPEVYYCEGMKFYGEKMVTLFGLKPYSGVPEKTVVFMGLYFDADYEIFKNHEGKKYVFWNGSDVSRLLQNKEWIDILQEHPATHICHNEQLQRELSSVGINAKIEPIFFADVNDYPVSYEYKDHLEVYMNAHPNREEEYGVNKLPQVAKKLKDVKFFVYGVEGEDTSNVHYMGWIDEKEADSKMSKHHVCLRLNEHDGFSQLVIKAGLWGHYVLTVQDIENTTKVEGVEDLIEKIEALKGTTEPCLKLRKEILSMNLNAFSWL
jgi:hypothetical protein